MKTSFNACALVALCAVSATSLAQPVSPSLEPTPIGPVPAVQGSHAKRSAPTSSLPPGLGGIAPQQASAAQVAPASSPALRGQVAPAATPPAQVEKPKIVAGSDRAPTLGDWEDLSERRAYKAAIEKMQAEETKQQPSNQLPSGPMPPLGQIAQSAQQLPALPVIEKKRTIINDVCPDDEGPCFFAVYGLSLPDGTNNYRGRLAMHGREVPGGVYKGKKFNGYTVTAISMSSISVTDKRGKTLEWPLRSFNEYAADPAELKDAKAQSSMPPGFTPFPSFAR